MPLKVLSDTKITRHVKILGNANLYDMEWKDYFDKRETYKMLNTLKGRKSLLNLWKKQNRMCPICKEPIDKDKKWNLSEKMEKGNNVQFLANDSCCRRFNHFSQREDFEPVPNQEL